MNLSALRAARTGLSSFKDPFEKDCIKTISTYCTKQYDGGWSYTGRVEFQNGETGGEQRFKGSSLADVLQKMEVFVDSL